MIYHHPFRLLPEHAYVDDHKITVHRLYPEEDDLHGHEFLELVYVMEGRALHQLGAKTYPVSAGDYFIVERGSVHRYTELRGFVIVNCLFMPAFVDRAFTNCPTLSALLAHEMRQFGIQKGFADQIFHDASGRIRSLVEAMEAEYHTRQAGWLELLRCHLVEILVCTERAAEHTLAARTHPAVAAMVEYIHDHSTETVSLSQLSSRLGYTSQYLCSLFHKEMGMTISAYVQQLRMEHCCRLLTDSALRISEIAQTVGYSDQKHFNHLFRRHTGFSPREFRAKVQRQKGADHV